MVKVGDYVRGDGVEGFVERIVDDNVQSKKKIFNWFFLNNFLVLKFIRTASREAGPDVTIDQFRDDLLWLWIMFIFMGSLMGTKFV